MIPMQYALRRRMMSKKPAPQWTLTIQNVASYTSVSINGKKLTAGSYVVDDGTVAHFEATGGMVTSITLDGATVASATNAKSKYDLVIHANYTATSVYQGLIAKWEITTQQ